MSFYGSMDFSLNDNHAFIEITIRDTIPVRRCFVGARKNSYADSLKFAAYAPLMRISTWWICGT